MANTLMTAGPWTGAEITTPPAVVLRPIQRRDLASIGQAYWQTYLDTPDEMTPAEATRDVFDSWDGAYGRWLNDGSLGAWEGDKLGGEILTVLDPPWDDVAGGPFIIDLFVLRRFRRQGVGRALVQSAWAAAQSGIGLRIEDTNTHARHLYEALGFHEAPRMRNP